MKKTLLFLVGIFTLFTFVSCDRHIPASKLPQQAQVFLTQNFPGSNVLSVERDGFKYDVCLMDGTSLEFKHSGDWHEVDCQMRPVPEGIIPMPIQTYVTTNFPLCFVVKIKQERREYEVELSNDLELKFDKAGNFIYAD